MTFVPQITLIIFGCAVVLGVLCWITIQEFKDRK